MWKRLGHQASLVRSCVVALANRGKRKGCIIESSAPGGPLGWISPESQSCCDQSDSCHACTTPCTGFTRLSRTSSLRYRGIYLQKLPRLSCRFLQNDQFKVPMCLKPCSPSSNANPRMSAWLVACAAFLLCSSLQGRNAWCSTNLHNSLARRVARANWHLMHEIQEDI